MQLAGLYHRKARKISLTALIDVVFILLMFFMLTSTFSQWKAVDFHSPVASTEPDADQPTLLILGPDGSLRMANGSLEIQAGQAVDPGVFRADEVLVLLPEADTRVQAIVQRLEELKNLKLAVTLGGVTEPSGRGD